MPSPELSHLYQAAVLWNRTTAQYGSDGYGQPLMDGVPVEIRCRWDDTKRECLDPEGNRIAVDATALVDRDIAIGSEMSLGNLSDWVGTGLGQDDDTLVMVVKT